MNLFPNLKKKQTGHVAIPVGAPSSVLGDLTPLAQLVQPMRSRMKEFDHACIKYRRLCQCCRRSGFC